MRLAFFAILFSLLLLAGCGQRISCTEPNKVISGECCLDTDDDDVCDNNQVQPARTDVKTEPSVKTTVKEAEPVEQDEEPQIVRYASKPEDQVDYAPNYQEGISDIRLSEPKQWVQIHKLSSYRSSRDKGQMEWMFYTVRNIGTKDMKLGVDFLFEDGITSAGATSPIGKDYTIPTLKPGQKITINQSLGMYYEGVELTKTITLRVYDKNSYPPEYLQTLKKSFKPVDVMDTMEIMQYGRDD